jgi:stringent starvation protein B
MTTSDNGDGDAPPSTSTRPYLVRALYQWALANTFTPQVLVATEHQQVQVPLQHIKENRIVLNIHPQSVRGLELGNEYLCFSARFSGKSFDIVVPVDAILAVYSRENGQGIVFQDSGGSPTPEGTNGDKSGKPMSGLTQGPASHLKLVK